MSKKNIILIIVILLFTGILALTQEYDSPDLLMDIDDIDDELNEDELIAEDIIKEIPEWVTQPRWYRSNAGGMALEEIPTRLSALRYKYALVIDFISSYELPDYLLEYYNDVFFIEARTLFKDGEETRKQWIFREFNGNARFIAVFTEQNEENEIVQTDNDNENDEEIVTEKKPLRYGFIEIYDENYSLSNEYKYYDDGSILKTDYFYKNGIITRAEYFDWEKIIVKNEIINDDEIEIISDEIENDITINDKNGIDVAINDIEEEYWEFVKIYTDTYRYNRSYYLRSVERKYHKDEIINLNNNSISVAFPQRIHDAVQKEIFISEKLNSYPDFFGDLFASKDDKMVFTTDMRGKILTQVLMDKDGTVIWEIENIWSRDRILSIVKKEKDTELLAEYEYDSDGNRIFERNMKNGVLERIVRTEKNKDIEELYIDNELVLTAVWEDGRKKSETRIQNN